MPLTRFNLIASTLSLALLGGAAVAQTLPGDAPSAQQQPAPLPPIVSFSHSSSGWTANFSFADPVIEIQWSLAKDPPNGLLGIRLDAAVEIPAELTAAGAEIVNWYEPEDVHEFNAAIERAISATSRARNMPINSASTCAR